MGLQPAALAQLTRGGVVESTHLGAVAVADADGTVVGRLGDIDALVYPRSALKPFQALATTSLLARAAPDPVGLAVACASHTGSDDAQIEAAHLLAVAGLDESALRCPPAWPADPATLRTTTEPSRLAHNCSGKHAAFLWAHTAGGGEPERYLDPGCPLQTRVREVLAAVTGAAPTGPAVDGCGAPAWRLPLVRLAAGYARLAAAHGGAPLAAVRAAMTARPDLVGGAGCADTALMASDRRVVAKRGAEGVLAAGMPTSRGPVGVAVKVADGAGRAAVPPVAAVLRALGATVPGALLRTPLPPGGAPARAWLEPAPRLVDWAAETGM
ncbi:MAG TPA: asparaginase [Egibacteraceae bacterium]|nr:asparaginase [Egibacteraceae bacterium]